MWKVSLFTICLHAAELVLALLFVIKYVVWGDLTALEKSLLIAKMCGNVLLIPLLIAYTWKSSKELKNSIFIVNVIIALFVLDLLIRFLTKAKFRGEELNPSSVFDAYTALVYVILIFTPI